MKYSKKITFYKITKIISFILIIITLFFIAGNLFINLFLGNIATNSNYKLDKPVSFLLLGTDQGVDRSSSVAGVRSDAVMVATLSPSNSRSNVEVDLISIPRDTLVYTPCARSEDGSAIFNKLADSTNSGYGKNQDIKEGIDCTKAAVENLLNIELDYYVETGFEGVINIINEIGGITVDVPYDFCEQNEKDQGTVGDDRTSCGEEAYFFKKGKQHLSGEEALSYARQRKLTSDYDRGIRQQQVIATVLQKIAANPTSYVDNFIKVFLNDFETNLTATDLSKFMNFGLSLYNQAFANLSENHNVIIDLKSSPYENLTDTKSELTSTKNNIIAKPITEYYSEDQISPFESETMISRFIVTNNATNVSTNPKEVDRNAPKQKENNSLVFEISAYSLASTELTINGGSYSYASYDTLYYTSNLFRQSLGLEEKEPIFDYQTAGLNQNEIL